MGEGRAGHAYGLRRAPREREERARESGERARVSGERARVREERAKKGEGKTGRDGKGVCV